MILYISGPMSGHPRLNFPEFNRVARKLRAAGYAVLNPAENYGGDQFIKREICMRLDLQQVLLADGLCMLDGWQKSPGAKLERSVGLAVGVPCKTIEWWLREYREGLCA